MGKRITLWTLLVGLVFWPGGAVLAAEVGLPKGQPGTSVEMPPIIAPMLNAQGKLHGYAYISTTLRAASPESAMYIRNKTPFIQDCFVREVNARNIGIFGEPEAVDKSALASRFLAGAKKIAGEKRVIGLEITQIQHAPLRPKAGT